MSERPNPTMIGAFVVGSILLLVVALLAITGGKFLTEKNRYVMFFDGSVKGLNPGAPVNFRGVRIGEVSDIRLLEKDDDYLIPVYVDIDVGRLQSLTGGKMKPKSTSELIARGLRAQLGMQSLLTGQLFIQLDNLPEKKPRLIDIDTDYPQVPTIPTTLEELGKALQEYPVEELMQKVMNTAEGIDRLVNSQDTQDTVRSFNQTLKNLDALVRNIEKQLGPISEKAGVLLEESSATMDDGRLAMLEARKLLGDARASLVDTSAALKQSKVTLENIAALTNEDSTMIFSLTTALEEITAAAIAVRRFAETAEERPEILLRGKR